jgi:methylmalonyl-CoA/ethylmalonyl-CoA epimerase
MSKNIISHVSIAVSDLEAGRALFENLTGRKPVLVKEVPEQKVKVAIFAGGEGAHDGGNIELVSPTSLDSPVGRFIAKKGEGLHHLCIYVDDLDARLAQLKAAGVRLIDETPKIGAEGDRIAFVHPSSCSGVLLELQEKSK